MTQENLRAVLTCEAANDHLFLMTMVEDLCAIPADKIDPFVVEYLKSKDVNELFLK